MMSVYTAKTVTAGCAPLLRRPLARCYAELLLGLRPVGRVGVRAAVTDAVDVDQLPNRGAGLILGRA
jgi:hypothetical protein